MIDPFIIYLIEMADKIRSFLVLGEFIGLLGLSIAVIDIMTTDNKISRHLSERFGVKDIKYINKMVVLIPLTLLIFSTFARTIIPSTEICYKMLAAKMITTEAINLPHDASTKYIDYAIQSLINALKK